MDTADNGIAWLGNVYQKFEDMWREVDGIMQQAEKQLETVGANVKKFCSESQLIGDALPQFSEAEEKGAAPESSLVQNTDDVACIKSPDGTDEDCDKRSLDDGDNLDSVEFVKSIFYGLSLEEPDETEVRKFQLQMSDRKGSSNSSLLHGLYHASQEIELDGGAKMIVSASEDVGGCNSLTEREDGSNNHVDMFANISADIQVSNTVNVVKLCRSIADNDAAYLTTTTIEPSPDGIELYDSLEESDSTMSLPVYDSADKSRSTLPLPESGSILEEWDNDVTKSGLQTLELSDKAKLDESCIIVDSSGLESISCEEVKSRSYKKKLRDAFASKTGLLKKQNHKQHADWSTGDLDAGFDQQKRKSFTATTLSENSNSPDYDFCESEWEIV